MQRERFACLFAGPIIDEFWEIELQDKKSGPETLRLLNKDVRKTWRTRKAQDIKRRDIVLLIDHIRERAPIGANRVLGALTRMFNFAAERGIINDSPCTRIRKAQETGRSRVLTDDEIKLLWTALNLKNRDVDMYRLSKLALKMILLTGQRPGEVSGMTWEEIGVDDQSRDVWRIPAARMKGKELHAVPLCPMALEVIKEARPYSSESRFVFRSSYVEDAAITSHALARAIARHWQEMDFKERFTPHDLRRTLRTRLADEKMGVSDIVAERVLGHKLQGILAVYNRHDYAEEKRAALGKWEKELRRILGLEIPESGGRLINFRKRG